MNEFPASYLFAALGAGFVALCLVALPITLIALADNEQRAGRLRFAIWFVIASASTAVFFGVEWRDQPPAVLSPLALLLWLAIYAWFGRIMVRRLNDVGRPRKLAFLLLVPYVNFVFAAYLLFARPPQLSVAPR